MMRGKWRYVLLAAAVQTLLIVGFLEADRLYAVALSPFEALIVVMVVVVLLVVGAVIAARWLGGIKKERPVFTAAEWFLTVCVGWSIAALYYRWFDGTAILDLQLHDTYFVLRYSFECGFFAVLFGLFAAAYYAYPYVVRRPLKRGLGVVHFWVTYLGSCIVFTPFFTPLLYGAIIYKPRRYEDYSYSRWLDYSDAPYWFLWVVVILLAAQVLFIGNLVYSAVKGRKPAD